MRLGANIRVAHTCHCGKRVERDGLPGLSCTKSAGRFSRHATLNSLIEQTLGSLDLPSMLEPRGLYRTDGKRPDGVTMIPWEMGKQLVWDVTVVDALAPIRLNQGSLCNPGTTATEAEARKIEKYREIIDNGYIFQPVSLEVQCSLGESSEMFITRLCKMLCRLHDDQRVKVLMVTLDNKLGFSSFAKSTCAKCYYQLRRITSIRKFLSIDLRKVLILTFIISRLDYCNSLLYGAPDYMIKKLQRVQNKAECLLLHQGSSNVNLLLNGCHETGRKKQI